MTKSMSKTASEHFLWPLKVRNLAGRSVLRASSVTACVLAVSFVSYCAEHAAPLAAIDIRRIS